MSKNGSLPKKLHKKRDECVEKIELVKNTSSHCRVKGARYNFLTSKAL